MDILPNFRALRYLGLWREKEEQHWLVKYALKPFAIVIILSFACLQFASLALHENSMKEATMCLFASLQFFDSFLKLTNFLTQRRRMIALIGKFRDGICTPRDEDEKKAVSRYARLVPFVFKAFLCMVYPTALSLLIVPLLRWNVDTALMNFPLKMYEIAGRGNTPYYVVTYAYQVTALAVNIAVHGSVDTMFPGFVLLTCAQMKLSAHRFTLQSRDDLYRATRSYMEHRQLIVEIVRHLESIYMKVILSFLFFSLITICTSIYNLSQVRAASVEAVACIMCLMCVLVQVYSYCWFGNELAVKSVEASDAVYNSNWESLTPRQRKYFFYAMFRCQSPLSISFHGFCGISMDVYVWVLKTSYAAYNLLLTISSDAR